MKLIDALMKSLPGQATRRREIKVKAGKVKYEHYFAVVSDKGDSYILSGPTGTIRRVTAEDQLRDDWTPFQEMPSVYKRKVKKAL